MIINIKEEYKKIIAPKNIFSIIIEILKTEDKIDQDKEHFWVFLLDSRNKIKLLELVTLGLLNSTMIHPREVFTRAVKERCASILIAHNHPSGINEPSEDDLIITKRLVQAGKILGIEVIDHIIIGDKNFYSFKERNLL